MRRWEYLIADDRNTMRGQPILEMNELGRDRWELVAARNTRSGVVEYLFKRELLDDSQLDRPRLGDTR